MSGVMDDVGKVIRDEYYWIPINKPCYLIMDNAGGHGTGEAIEKYTQILREKYNINLIWQVPRSPYTKCFRPWVLGIIVE